MSRRHSRASLEAARESAARAARKSRRNAPGLFRRAGRHLWSVATTPGTPRKLVIAFVALATIATLLALNRPATAGGIATVYVLQPVARLAGGCPPGDTLRQRMIDAGVIGPGTAVFCSTADDSPVDER